MTAMKALQWSALVVGAFIVCACSDGGGSAVAPFQPPQNSDPTYTAGVFEPSSEFENQCEIVRTGVDIEGVPFPDRSGSTTIENFWLRSWTNETYLWNTEVADRNPASYNDRLVFFDLMKTFNNTPSGLPKDNFHFSIPTDEYLEMVNSVPSPSYGAQVIAYSSSLPRDYRILYTEPNSPASAVVDGQANLERGTRILRIDGIDLVNGGVNQAEIDILSEGLFPTVAGQPHTFEVRDPGEARSRTVVMTPQNLSEKPVNRTRIIETETGDVGYILFNTFSPFSSEEEIVEAMSEMAGAGVTDLVLDLRYNGGGLLAIASQLSYMIAGDDRTAGKTFELLRFNEASGERNPVTGDLNEPMPFFSSALGFSLEPGFALPSLDLDRVFILSTDNTCSASESVINALRGVDVDVVLIGRPTCGKPYGFYPTDNCGETYFSIQFQGVNDKGFGDYAEGFAPEASPVSYGVTTPGCYADDDLGTELGDADERLLATALSYRETGACPAAFASLAAAPIKSAGGEGGGLDLVRPDGESVFSSNRDMRMPR